MTTFNTGNYVRITGRQSGRNDLLKTNLTGVPYSLPLPLFHLQIFHALFLRATLHYPNARNRLCKFSMDATCFRVRRRTITFPSHFCYHISVLPCSRYVSSFFFLFLTHVQDRMIEIDFSEILPLRNIKVNNSKFYLILRSGCFVNGCVFTRVYVICKICEKLRRIHSC